MPIHYTEILVEKNESFIIFAKNIINCEAASSICFGSKMYTH